MGEKASRLKPCTVSGTVLLPTAPLVLVVPYLVYGYSGILVPLLGGIAAILLSVSRIIFRIVSKRIADTLLVLGIILVTDVVLLYLPYIWYGTSGIFASFLAGGLILLLSSICIAAFDLRMAEATAYTILVSGYTLIAGAVLVYLEHGCVFGCPG